MQLSKEFDCTMFSTLLGVITKTYSDLATFLRFCSSVIFTKINGYEILYFLVNHDF